MSNTPTPKVLVCIFAHPDDEAFGPGGTIAYYSQQCEVHVICVTDGGAGRSSDPKHANILAQVRRTEFENSTKILGVKSTIFLNYPDGSLCNNNYHEVADRLKVELDQLHPDTVLTFDTNGISGHLDHIAVAMITSYLWERNDYIKTLMYYCRQADPDQKPGSYFVYFPPGYASKDLDLSLDVSSVFDTMISAMRAHVSQNEDGESIIKNMGDKLKTEHFRILEKKS